MGILCFDLSDFVLTIRQTDFSTHEWQRIRSVERNLVSSTMMDVVKRDTDTGRLISFLFFTPSELKNIRVYNDLQLIHGVIISIIRTLERVYRWFVVSKKHIMTSRASFKYFEYDKWRTFKKSDWRLGVGRMRSVSIRRTISVVCSFLVRRLWFHWVVVFFFPVDIVADAISFVDHLKNLISPWRTTRLMNRLGQRLYPITFLRCPETCSKYCDYTDCNV